MSLGSIFCYRLVPFTVLLVAIILGWLASQELPLGVMFATMIPLMQGHLPATVVGHGKMKGTPPVPDDMTPMSDKVNHSYLTLPYTEDRMPQTGLGLCCRYSAYDDVLVYRSVLWYLLLGGRHLDGAHLYLNHKAVGQAIQEAVKRGIPRAEIFVTTKVFPTQFGYETTREWIPKFLEELQLEYIDLVLLHFPGAPQVPVLKMNECQKRNISASDCRKETWKALTEAQQQGLIRNIGVSNFAVSHLQDIQSISASNMIANNQIQYSPFVDPSVQETVQYCAEHNITITAYSPLGGLLDKDKAFAYGVLQDLSKKYHRSVSSIMLRWAMQSLGAAVIPGTGNPEHMKENLDIYNFVLSPEDVALVDGLKHHSDAKKFSGIDVRQME